MNIQEDYVSFEVAKLLKEKGFNENTEHKIWYVIKQFSTGCYWNSCTYKVGDITREYNNDCCISMPTLQMAMKWLRLHHHLHIIVEVTWKDKIPHYQWRIEVLNTQNTIVDTPCCNKAEQACEAAIKYCLEKLI
jgi:hypothetical protein